MLATHSKCYRLSQLVVCLMILLGTLVWGWLQWSEWPNPVREARLEKADMIVVLGGGALERPGRAFELYHRGISRHLLVTGDGDTIYHQLLKLGVPATNIIHEKAAHSTWENAELSGGEPQFQKAHRIILVTTWFHGPRALAVFEKQFPEKSFCISAEGPKYPLSPWDISFRRRERYATIYYWLFHGIWPGRERYPAHL